MRGWRASQRANDPCVVPYRRFVPKAMASIHCETEDRRQLCGAHDGVAVAGVANVGRNEITAQVGRGAGDQTPATAPRHGAEAHQVTPQRWRNVVTRRERCADVNESVRGARAARQR